MLSTYYINSLTYFRYYSYVQLYVCVCDAQSSGVCVCVSVAVCVLICTHLLHWLDTNSPAAWNLYSALVCIVCVRVSFFDICTASLFYIRLSKQWYTIFHIKEARLSLLLQFLFFFFSMAHTHIHKIYAREFLWHSFTKSLFTH